MLFQIKTKDRWCPVPNKKISWLWRSPKIMHLTNCKSTMNILKHHTKMSIRRDCSPKSSSSDPICKIRSSKGYSRKVETAVITNIAVHFAKELTNCRRTKRRLKRAGTSATRSSAYQEWSTTSGWATKSLKAPSNWKQQDVTFKGNMSIWSKWCR